MKSHWKNRLALVALGQLMWLPTCSVWSQEADIFSALDANSDGFMSLEEVPAEKKELFERLLSEKDGNKDGKISREEFGGGPSKPPGGAELERIRPTEVIKRFDSNGDGKLTKEEAPERMLEHFEKIDANADGFVDLTEFQQSMQRLMQAQGGTPAGQPDPERIFAQQDANQDGQLTPDEVPEEHRERFKGLLERMGLQSVNKEQFAKGLAMLRGGNPGGPPTGAPGFPPGMMRGPLMKTLDANGDGELSSEEIAGAAKALAQLDKDSDGKLSASELAPPGQGFPGAGFPGASLAGGAPPGFNPLDMLERRLTEADKNGDRKLQKDEATGPLATLFDKADANRDGELDETEIRQGFESMRGRMRNGGDQNREKLKQLNEKQ